MQVSCSALWASEHDPIERLLWWSWLAGKLGASPQLPRPFLIAIRGAAPGDDETHEPIHEPKYRDTFVLLTSGQPIALWAGSSMAYQVDSKLSPDVDGDKRGDVGSIRTGRYLLTDKRSEPYPIFEVTLPEGDKRIPCVRDLNHDRRLSPDEVARAESARTGVQVNETGYYSTAVLMHTGFDAPADSPHRSSISCLTSSVKWLELMRQRAQPSRQVDLVIANAWDLVPLAEERARSFTTYEEPFPLPKANS